MKVWTDYPLCEEAVITGPALDKPDVEAPIREVELLGWDRNKYCLVALDGNLYSFKLGYTYTKPGRCGEVPSMWEQRDKLPFISISLLKETGN